MTAKRLWGILFIIAGVIALVPPVVLALVPVIVETWGFGGVGYPGGFTRMESELVLIFVGGAALIAGIWLLTEQPKK